MFASSKLRLVMDITTSKDYIGRPAVGIVRVEREIAKHLFTHKNIAYVYYDNRSHCFREISAQYAEGCFSADVGRHEPTISVNNAALKSGDLAYGPRFEFSQGDVFINCGLPWDNNFLLDMYLAKRRVGFKVVQVVYDLIPTIMPELCVPGMITKFPKFIIDTAWTADAIFCISESTKQDLESYIDRVGCPKPLLFRIAMGVDPVYSHVESASKNVEDKDRSVLYISSIEPRKNHLFMFNVWQEAFKAIGDKLPTLTFVGSQGWSMNDAVFYINSSELASKGKVEFKPHLSDRELDQLYRECLFTVYPSLYEGWGLPISESLSYGKFCIASASSSMPEAGQGLIDLIRPRDFYLWSDTCIKYIEDRNMRLEREEHIRLNRKLSPWQDCAKAFVNDVTCAFSN